MDSRDDSTDTSATHAVEPATSTDQSDEDTDEIGGFIFNNIHESDDSFPEHKAVGLDQREKERIVALVRLQPTKNAELQDQWGLASGSDVHQYLESQLKEYYYRDDDGYIRATDSAEEFTQHHQDVYQDVTEPEDNADAEDTAPDLQQRDLVIALVTLTQELGHLPSADDIDEHGEYQHQRYREEFDGLFQAYQAGGILPDDVTRQDFYGENELESATEGEAEIEKEAGSVSGPEPEEEITESEEPEEDAPDTEPVELDVAELDVDQPNFQVPQDFGEADLVEEIQRFADIIGEPPTEELVEAYGRFPIDAYGEVFGSWENSLEAAGCNPACLPDWSLRKYTHVEVLDGIRAVADELGRPPMTTEVGDFVEFSGGLGSTRFGSWKTALELSGLDPSERPSVDSDGDRKSEEASTEESEEEISKNSATSTQTEPSRQDLLDEIKRLDESLDRIPYESDMDQDGRFTPYTYRNRFGSWDEALEATGIDKEAVLLEDIQQVVDMVEGDLTQPAMNEYGKYSAGMVARYFDSWSDAKERLKEWEAPGDDGVEAETDVGEFCEKTEEGEFEPEADPEAVSAPESKSDLSVAQEVDEAGTEVGGPNEIGEADASEREPVEIDTSSKDVDRPSFDVSADVGKSDMVNEILRFAIIINEPPTKELVVAYGRYPADEYRAAFGSWGAALEAAGLDPGDIPDWNARSHTNVDILDGLRAVADVLGHAPTTTETGKYVDFSPGLASLRFGSWGDALETAGLDPSERPSVQDNEPADSADSKDVDDSITTDDDDGENDDPIGSVIDDKLEDILLSDDNDDSV